MHRRSSRIAFLSIVAALFALGAGVASAKSRRASVKHAHARAARAAAAPRTVGHLRYLGTVNLKALAAHSAPATATGHNRSAPLRRKSGLRPGTSQTANPNPAPLPLAPQSGPPTGFVGLTANDNNLVNAFNLEPPDQGLCAHGNTVLEEVNLAIAAYTEAGQRLAGPVSLNAFYGLPPAFNPATGVSGPFLSDPRCYYDSQTQRWFVTSLEVDVDPYTGNPTGPTSELIAVSSTSDPTGNYGLFDLPSSNDGTNGQPRLPNCPCFGDQPRIGADKNGFYISDDVFPNVDFTGGTLNSDGGFLYAISKQGLVSAASAGGLGTPPYVGVWLGAVQINGEPANAVQPAETPQGGTFPSNREYFLATTDFEGFATSGGAGSNSVVLWTLLDTASLNNSSPSVTLTDAIVPTEPYTPVVNPPQKGGPHPLGQSLGDPVQPINADDDRMQQVQYVAGHLYSSLSTGVGSGSSSRTGVAWFNLATSGSNATAARQGYLAAPSPTSLLYPAIGLKPGGKGAMTFSIAGPNVYPSAAYVPFNQQVTGTQITIDGPGNLPEDGFTCYAQFGFGPPCRWGDYSAATADGAGHIVTGDEMITNVQRTDIANWDTYVDTLTP
jgi:hypothetical protein